MSAEVKPIYKIGDKVLIAKRTHNSGDYRFVYVDDMTEYAGQIATIVNIEKSYDNLHKLPDDFHEYHIDLDNCYYSWASSMFEPISKNDVSIQNFIKSKKHYKLNFNN